MDRVNGRDLVVRTDGGLQVFLNDGTGNLITLATVAAAGNSGLVMADLDDDLGPDALIASPSISVVQILSSDGAGNLSEDRSRDVAGGPVAAGVGNFDGG